MLTEKNILDLADRAYRHGVADFAVDRTRCALLVIDMQDEFVRPGWTSSWIPEATRQVPAIQALILGCRQAGIPVIFSLFSATHHFWDRPETGGSMPNRFPEIPPGDGWFQNAHVWSELQPDPGDVVIHKSSYGAFFDTPLETILKRMKKDTIIVSGTLTNCCCGMTARQGYERGFKVLFGSDVTSTYTKEMQEAELGIQRFAFSKVLSSQEILSFVQAPFAFNPRPGLSFPVSTLTRGWRQCVWAALGCTLKNSWRTVWRLAFQEPKDGSSKRHSSCFPNTGIEGCPSGTSPGTWA